MMDEKKSIYHDQGFIVFHTGGTDPKRSWPEKKWVELAESLSRDHKIAIVKTPETGPVIRRMKERKLRVEIFEGDLIAFKQWLKNQKMLIGIDSMPGHLAAYLGIPVISIFGSQDHNLTCPLGKWTTIIHPDIPCYHQRDHWRLCAKCMASIDGEKVSSAVVDLISRVKNRQ
jgi:ADP-heptose:LPS heptosyltransferase